MKSVLGAFLISIFSTLACAAGLSPYYKTDEKSKYKFQLTEGMCSYLLSESEILGPGAIVTCKAELLDLPEDLENRYVVAYQIAELSNRETFDIDPVKGLFMYEIWETGISQENIHGFIRDVVMDLNREPILISIGKNPSEF